MSGLTTQRRRVRFQVAAEPDAQVFLAGTFNGWKPGQTALRLDGDSGLFTTVLHLPKDTYEYKFVVNDRWLPDPTNPRWRINEFGSLNSVLDV